MKPADILAALFISLHLSSKLYFLSLSRWAEKSYQINDRLPHIGDLDAWLDDVTTAEYCVRAGAAAQPYEPESTPSSKPNQKDRKEKQNHKTFVSESIAPASTSSSTAPPSSSSSS